MFRWFRHPIEPPRYTDSRTVKETEADNYTLGVEDGIQKAIEWLQAGYEYGDMPEWRQMGVDWISDCVSDNRKAEAIAANNLRIMIAENEELKGQRR